MFNKKQIAKSRTEDLPVHIAVVMDGNGRWAKKRGLPRTAGHTVGAANFKTITKYAAKIGIKYLTVYAFSTENWNRPVEEVGALMHLFKDYLEEALRDFLNENIKVNFIGDTSKFSKELRELIENVKQVSRDRTGMVLNIAMNYGSRAEIVRAARLAADASRRGHEITEEMLSEFMYTGKQPDPDLVIRPSGEHRLSNFLLWQSAYAEFVYFDILWPDFKPKHLDAAIDIYKGRSRRFGGV